MNYDKLQGRLEEAKAQLAEYEQNGLLRLAKEYAERKGSSAEQVNELIASQLALGLDEKTARQALVDAQLEDFMRRNPDADPRQLPDEVLEAWKSGVPLGEAIAGYTAGQQVRELEQQIAEMQANADNAAASMGMPKSNGAATPKVLSEDTIRNMSKAELERNHNRIWEYLTGVKRET